MGKCAALVFNSNPIRISEKPLLEEPIVIEIARKHNKSPAQVILRHAIQLGIVVLTKSDIKEEIMSNFDVI